MDLIIYFLRNTTNQVFMTLPQVSSLKGLRGMLDLGREGHGSRFKTIIIFIRDNLLEIVMIWRNASF